MFDVNAQPASANTEIGSLSLQNTEHLGVVLLCAVEAARTITHYHASILSSKIV